MRWKVIAAALLLMVALPDAQADGCKFASDGRKVPEREQRAFIEWDDGTETLYVAALGDPTTEGTVWVVPIRATAAAVWAEPVDSLPAVTYYQTLRGLAEWQLREAIAVAGLLDSGGLCCPFFIGGCGGSGGAKSAIETSRVEKLGMIVTVVAAESRAEIERYLDAQGVSRVADLSSLDPYFGQPGYAFVCGWVAEREKPVAATGLKVVFPSPTLWFPLRATQAYTDPIETVVYVRGFVKPARGCDLPGLSCQYIFGNVRTLSVGETFTADRPGHDSEDRHNRLERMTRITLTTDPQKWDRDLELVPGTTPVGTTALAVTGWAGFLGPLWSAMLGAILGLAIPRLTVPKAERRRVDWLAGALTGASIVLTIWVSALVFSIWRWRRFRDHPNQPRRYVVLPALAVAHFVIVLGVCNGLIEWIAAGQ